MSHKKNIKKIWWACFYLVLSSSLLIAQNASATRILILTTSETASDAIAIQQNCINEFRNAGTTEATVEEDALNGATMTLDDFTSPAGVPYDIVVTCIVYNQVTPANVAIIDEAIRTRRAQAFFFFDEQHTSPSLFDSIRNAKTNWTLAREGDVGEGASQHLNTASTYSSSFTTLNPYGGNSYRPISGVPVNNALYLPPGVSIPPTGPTTSAATVLVPTSESYLDAGGVAKGACLFYNTDTSGFDSVRYAGNASKIATAFIAATKSGGSCNIPSGISKAFSPASLNPGGTSTLTITITNNIAPTPITGVNVTDNLPDPLQISTGAITNSCGGTLTGNPGDTRIRLTGGTFSGSTCTISVPVLWPATAVGIAACGTTVTNVITPNIDFTTDDGQVNDRATTDLACAPIGPIAVTKIVDNPTVGTGGLLSYTIIVGNNGTLPVSNVVVNDSPPANALDNVAWICAGTGVACPNSGDTGDINETIPSLPGGARVIYTLTGTVRSDAPANFTNTVSVDPNNAICASGNPKPCTASASVPLAPEISVTQTSDTTSAVMPGDNISYVITVAATNNAAATNTIVHNPTPAGIDSGTWTCAGTCGTPSTGSIPLDDTIPILAWGNSATYTVTAKVAASPPSTITNIASVMPGDGGVCLGGVAPPCNSNPVTTQIVFSPSALPSSASVPIPAWALLAMVAMLLGAGITFRQRKR